MSQKQREEPWCGLQYVMLINWDRSFECGIAEIDQQHQMLVQIINDLFKAMSIGAGQEVMADILKRLTNYTQYHFSTEEKYFDLFSFEDTEFHKEEHRFFIGKINRLRREHSEWKKQRQGASIPTTIDLYEMLQEWLLNHIQGSDREYVELFKARGL